METIFTNILAVTGTAYVIGLAVYFYKGCRGRFPLWLPPLAAVNVALSVGKVATATDTWGVCLGVCYVAAWVYTLVYAARL